MTSRLLSLNVGLPRELEWEGRTVRTAIWKAPVDGPRMVRRINIDGDDQADRVAHGGEHRAVYVYQLDSYRHWERELGRDDFSPGQFGENFTVEGLADDEVCIGDRYRIGGALFEVTQPRVTCYRLGIRMDEPAMPALLVSHHRPGFYMRVLEEGVVEAGDEIMREASGPEQLTVAEIDALLYLPGRSRRTLRRALRIPALSVGWQGSFRDLLARAEDGAAPAAAAPAWPGFLPLRVTAITPESSDVTSFRLQPDDPPASGLAGQYLTFRLEPDGPDATPLLRSYSLSSLPGAGGYRISVKREPGGAGGAFLHERVRVGDRIAAAAPRGTFVLRDGDGPVVLMSAGVGATPVLAMLHALAREPTRARSGGCTAPATAPSTHSAPRSTPCSPRSPMRTGSSATAPPDRRMWRARRSMSPAGSTPPRSPRPACPSTPTTTCAARMGSCAGSARRLRRAASRPSASAPRRSAAPAPSAPAWWTGQAGRRTRPRARPVPARWSGSRGATWRCRGTPGTAACSSWRRRVTSRSASAAGPACATAASAACSPVP